MLGIILLTCIGAVSSQLIDSSVEELSKEMSLEAPFMSQLMDRGPRARIRIFSLKPDHFNMPRLPPFLKSASDETKKRFREIFANQTLTFMEKKTQIDRLMEGESDVVKAEFVQFKKTLEERKKRMEQQHKEAVSKLSKEAQEADSKIIQLFKNESITYSDRRQMMREIFENLPKNVRDELKTLRPHNRFGGRSGKCCTGFQWPIKFGKMIKIDRFKGINDLQFGVQPSDTAATALPTTTITATASSSTTQTKYLSD